MPSKMDWKEGGKDYILRLHSNKAGSFCVQLLMQGQTVMDDLRGLDKLRYRFMVFHDYRV